MLRFFKGLSAVRSTVLRYPRLAMRTSSGAAAGEKCDGIGGASTTSVEAQVYRIVSARLDIPFATARYVVEQSKKGSTVPFLARYRRDETGHLDETALRQLLDMAEELREVHRRRAFMLKSLQDRGLLTDELRGAFEKLVHLNQLEDAWEPFKEKKTSLSHRGREAGLEPLAKELLYTADPITDISEKLRCVTDGPKLLQSIIVEEVQRCDEVRQLMLVDCRQSGVISSSVVTAPRKKVAKEAGADAFDTLKKQFAAYDNRRWSVQHISAHHVLALQRGEGKGVLAVKMIPHGRTRGVFFAWTKRKFIGTQRQGPPAVCRLLSQCLEAAYEHVLKSTHTTVRRDLKKSAEKEAIAVFAHSLRHILLQCPMRDARLLSMDPGVTNGVKCVALDENGGVLTRFKCTIMDEANMKDYISSCVEKLRLNKIVIGNGTASRQVADIVADTIEQKKMNAEYAIVSEAGASVYSVSDVAKEEFPTLDPMYRGAVNIGRRIIDPLSELVKIPVRSMGIGMYQHDISETELLRALNRVVESCVTCVGVNAMTANRYVMEKIPGVTKRMVDQIVLMRHSKKLKSREDLRRVPGMTEAVYQQIAGFFRFPNSSNPLDNTNIHPESYATVHKLLELYKGKERREVGNVGLHMKDEELKELATRIGCGQATLELMARELASPALDPRSELPHAGLFRRAPRKATDLKPGDKLTGVVQSVTTFGAFVDVGLHDNVLVRNINIDTVHTGTLLDELNFEGFDQLGRLRVRYDGLAHAPGGGASQVRGQGDQLGRLRVRYDGLAHAPGGGASQVRGQGLSLESEDVFVSVPAASRSNSQTLSGSLASVRGERQQLFASPAPGCQKNVDNPPVPLAGAGPARRQKRQRTEDEAGTADAKATAKPHTKRRRGEGSSLAKAPPSFEGVGVEVGDAVPWWRPGEGLAKQGGRPKKNETAAKEEEEAP
ncbi:putative transcription modulator/accessory protein, partial [Trypanosoma grayi]|uniref:putative transcription modulator/accessory protein n=1 Tax=Trypanosoma grayi TaxID=71804 RepID=UPI0004F49702